MKLLLRATILAVIVFATFAAFSSGSNQAFGTVGPRPAPMPCAPGSACL